MSFWLLSLLAALVLVVSGTSRPTSSQSAIVLSPAWLQLHTFPEALAHSRTNPTPQPRLSSANSGRASSHGDNAQAAAPSSHAPSEARSLAKEGERAQRSVAERARGGGISNFGRRTTKTYDGKITEYIWDGDDLIHERTTDSKSGQSLPLTTWIHEPGTFTPLAKIEGRKRYGIVSDHLGSPTLLATEAGRVAWQAQLDVYGIPREESAGVRPEDKTDNPWRFPGQYEDAETGLYYNRFRYYDPELGRYLSEDPIGLLGGEALYGYVHEPLGWWDPLGLSCTRGGVKRTNSADWRELRDLWNTTGVDALSKKNLERIAAGRTPVVDDDWTNWFPGDTAHVGEMISMHHVGGGPLTVPLPKSRHIDAHMPGGYKLNPGGPGTTG